MAALVCHVCRGENIATSFCITCNPHRFLCNECAPEHLKHCQNHQMRWMNVQNSPSTENKENVEMSHHHGTDQFETESSDEFTSGETDEDSEETDVDSEEKDEDAKQKTESEESFASEDEDLPVSVPGAPVEISCGVNMVELQWSKPDENYDYFRIRYRKVEDEDEWKEIDTKYENDTETVDNLMPDTQYVFQVKGIFKDKEGEYSPSSELITTEPSLAQKMCFQSTIIKEGDFPIFQIPVKAVSEAHNDTLKIRKIVLGAHVEVKTTKHVKTIVLLGKMGTGKTAMIDAIINYILGINFADKFRFTLNSKKEKGEDGWLTVYSLQPLEGSKIEYTLNVIDTPEFQEDRDVNEQLSVQLASLSSANGKECVKFLDAICIFVKDYEMLDASKIEYSLQTMLSHFGRDLSENICVFTTFSDSEQFPVMTTVSDHQFPLLGKFNYSVLFAENSQTNDDRLCHWNIGWKSLDRFFLHLNTLTRKSMELTKELTADVEQIEKHILTMKQDIISLFKDITEEYRKKENLSRQKEFLELCKNFEYEKKQSKLDRYEIAKGHHSVYCPVCQNTCHEDCKCTESSSTAKCPIIESTNKCTVCVDKCQLVFHAKSEFIIKRVDETVKKTNEQLKSVFEKVKKEKDSTEKEIEKIGMEIKNKQDKFVVLLQNIAKYKNSVEARSLYPYHKSIDWPIVEIIKAEETLEHENFQNRIKVAKDLQEKLLRFSALKHVWS